MIQETQNAVESGVGEHQSVVGFQKRFEDIANGAQMINSVNEMTRRAIGIAGRFDASQSSEKRSPAWFNVAVATFNEFTNAAHNLKIYTKLATF